MKRISQREQRRQVCVCIGSLLYRSSGLACVQYPPNRETLICSLQLKTQITIICLPHQDGLSDQGATGTRVRYILVLCMMPVRACWWSKTAFYFELTTRPCCI